MSRRRYSTKAIVRLTDSTGRCESYYASRSGLVHTEYPAHSEHGAYTYQYKFNGRGDTEQLFDAKGFAVLSNGGEAFPSWLAGYVGGSLVTDPADWQRALEGVSKRGAELKGEAVALRRALWGDDEVD